MQYCMENKKELFISCQCNSEVLGLVRFDDEDEVYLTVYKYFSTSKSFFARLKMAIKVLIKGRLDTADVILDKENFEQLKQF